MLLLQVRKSWISEIIIFFGAARFVAKILATDLMGIIEFLWVHGLALRPFLITEVTGVSIIPLLFIFPLRDW
jgi:hypothetical protein